MTKSFIETSEDTGLLGILINVGCRSVEVQSKLSFYCVSNGDYNQLTGRGHNGTFTTETLYMFHLEDRNRGNFVRGVRRSPGPESTLFVPKRGSDK